MTKRLYSTTEQDLAFEWCEKWLELSILINEVTGTDELPWSPPPPSDLDELCYQSLRFWLFNHQMQFIPLWADFHRSHSKVFYECSDCKDELDHEDMKYRQNPLLYFYEPENLYNLSRQMDLQNGVDLWEPSEYRASLMRPILIKMGQLMAEFVDWVSGRTNSP